MSSTEKKINFALAPPEPTPTMPPMKTKTAILVLAMTCTAHAIEPARNYLTTRTVKTGTPKTIMVAVKQHPEQSITLTLDTKINQQVRVVTIPAGDGVVKTEYKVNTGWRATLTSQSGQEIDAETATRKTGVTSIK